MRIVHLSDIHYSIKQKNFNEYVVDPLFRDLLNFHKEIQIDLILFTGDLIDKAGAPYNTLDSFDSFDLNFITPLLELLNLDKGRFLFIPGNHDIDRTKVISTTELGIRMQLDSRETIEKSFSNLAELNLERMEDYKIFENYYFDGNIAYRSNDFGYSYLTSIKDLKIGIAGFNSSWRCYDDSDKNNLIVGKVQFDNVSNHFSDQDLDLKIALMHHPFEYLHDAEVQYSKNHIIREYDLLLTGHTHETNAHSYTTSLGNGCVLCTAPSNWEKNNFLNHGLNRNGYNILDFSPRQKTVEIHFRRYNYEKNCFVSDTDRGEGDSASSTFTLGNSAQKDSWDRFSERVGYIKDQFIEGINKNLVSYNTDTNAPKNLNELFVLPQIKLHNYKTGDTEKYKEYSDNLKSLLLEDIYNQQNNLMLFGPSESGKTTILHKIATELIEYSHAIRKLPVYIDLKGLTIDIEKKVNAFLGMTNKGALEILSEQESVLLLDNFKYVISNPHMLKRIEELLNKYPKMKVVATYDSLLKENLPTEYLSHNISNYFDSAVIEYFKSTEIEDLMTRWFSKNEAILESEHLTQVIKNFNLLNIPSTPLAVSLFLWIYEKQKGFVPLNNAVMVQNFIEKLFEKHSIFEKHSSKFDFHNKENLLAHISMYMYKTGNESYSLEENNLRVFIKELNEKKKIGIESKDGKTFYEWIIEYFVEKGIFVYEITEGEKYYRFKLNCFFQYFLAKGMIISKDFKEQVLAEENYLSFQDEIDYYSGLNRHDEQILEMALYRMENEFASIFLEPQVLLDALNEKEEIIPFDQMFAKGPTHKQKLLIENVDSHEISEVLDSQKEGPEALENFHNSLLANSNNTKENSFIVNKIPQTKMSKSEILQGVWILVAKILKNAEDIEDGALKDRAYRSVIICSLILLKTSTVAAENELKDSKGNEDYKDFYKFFIRFSLFLHQNLLFSVMGTSKLIPVMDEYLKEKERLSNVEIFISLFLLIESGSESFKKPFNIAIKDNVNSAVREFVLVKLMMLDSNTKNKERENYYREKINELIKKANEGSHVVGKQKALNRFQSNDHRKEIAASLAKNKQ